MTHHWDEFSKSLTDSAIPRRQSLRLLGAALAGALLSPLGAATAWAGRPDPCKSFCRCRNKSQQSACLAACNACEGDTNRLCGTCGSYVCCAEPGPYENGACVSGKCEYWCVEGATDCGGTCTDLLRDPDNCGACGNVCGGATPLCFEGACRSCEELGGTYCDGECVNLLNDPYNCGACGHVCYGDEDCVGGMCQRTCIPDCGPGTTHGEGWCGDDGCGGRCGCPDGMYCPAFSNWCAVSEPTPF